MILSEAFLNSVFEQSPYAQWISDENGTLIKLNQACRDLLGISDEEVVGKYNVLKDDIVERQGFLPLVKAVFEQGKKAAFTLSYDTSTLKQLDLRHQVAKILDVTVSPVINSSGKVTNAIIQHVDITARIQAEKKLQTYGDIVSRMQTGLYVFRLDNCDDDRSFRLVFANEASTQALGLSREGIIGKKMDELFPTLRAQGLLAVFVSVLKTGKPAEFPDYPFSDQRINGYYSLKIFALPDDCVCVLVDDVTQRKRTEIELQQANERIAGSNREWERTFDSMSDGVALLSTKWEILNINESFCAMIGKNRIDMIGKKCFDVVHGRDTPLPGCPCQSVLESKKKADTELFEPNLKVWLAVSVSPVLDRGGEVQFMIHIVRDITERKLMEWNLRNWEQELRTVVNDMPVPQFVIGVDHCVRYWNKALEEISGIKTDDVVGTDQHWKAFYDNARPCLADLLVDESYDKIAELYPGKAQKSSTINGAYEATDFFPAAKSGGKWLHFSATAIRNSDGKIIGAIETLEDITERKEIQDRLIASEEQYRTLVNNLNVAVFRVPIDVDGDFIRVNPAMASLLGYDSVEELFKVKPVELYVDPTVRNEYLEKIRRDGVIKNNEARLKRKDGTSIWASITSRAHYDARGNIDWVDGIGEDITERKDAEDALQNSESKLRALFNNMSSGVVVYEAVDNGADFIIKEFNRAAENIEKVSKKDIVGKRVSEVFPGVRDFGIFDAFKRVWQTGVSEFLPVKVYKDQRIVGWRENYVYRLLTNEVVAVYDDVTARKQAEEERARLFNMSIDMMAVAGFDGYFKQVNPSWTRTLGWTEDEMKSKPYLEYVHPDDIRKTLEAVDKMLQGQPMHNFKNRYRAKDGAYHWLSWNAFSYSEQKILLAGARDITEEQKIQDALEESERHVRRLNLELEERVSQRTAQLESSMKELDSFSYSVSHDLQAPLRAIDGYAHIILEDHAAQLDEEGRQQFNRISANITKMGQLINDLLSLSRLDRKELSFGDIDMDKLVRRCIDELKSSYESREVVIEIKDLASARGDESLLREALANLLANAIKFTRPRQKAIIEIGSYAADTERVYYVKDNGVGFNMAYAGNIFKEFVRLHHENEFEGTGVGLSIVHRIVSRHGGRIWTEAEVDKGAAFYFTLGKNQRVATQ